MKPLTLHDLEQACGGWEAGQALPVGTDGQVQFPEGTSERAKVNYGRCKGFEERAGRAHLNICDTMLQNAARDGRRFKAMSEWGSPEAIWRR